MNAIEQAQRDAAERAVTNDLIKKGLIAAPASIEQPAVATADWNMSFSLILARYASTYDSTEIIRFIEAHCAQQVAASRREQHETNIQLVNEICELTEQRNGLRAQLAAVDPVAQTLMAAGHAPEEAMRLALEGRARAQLDEQLAARIDQPVSEPVLWLEAEESARGQSPRWLLGEGAILFSTGLHATEPTSSNPRWPLYAAPQPLAAQPAPEAGIPASPAVDVELLQIDLAWHKESLKRHVAKLHAVWAGIAEAVTKATGKPCGYEPLDDLDAALRHALPANWRDTIKAVISDLDDGIDAPGHCHTVPGVWDAGGRCEICANWSKFKALAAAPAPEIAKKSNLPDGWREFLMQCSATSGLMVNGNNLSRMAFRLLAAAPLPPTCFDAAPDEPDHLLAGLMNQRMILCVKCGCKRCPHANDPDNYVCTGSNEPGQPGSAYP